MTDGNENQGQLAGRRGGPSAPEYRPGDIANGYVLGHDNQWHPLAAPAPALQSPQRNADHGIRSPEIKAVDKTAKIVYGALGLVAAVGLVAFVATSGEPPTNTAANSTPSPTAPSTTPTPPPPPASAGTVKVDDWSVKAVDVDKDASAAIEDANMFNSDPDFGYVIVTLEGTNGASSVKDLHSFTVKLQGSDRVIYRDESFLMVMPQDLATEAAPGGTVKAQFVFDLPQSALGSGALLLVDDTEVALP